MSWAGGETRAWRGVALTLAALALALRVLVPSGWMVDARAGAPAGLVICTGHGPLVLPGKDAPTPPKKTSPDPACPFAGLGAAPIAPPLAAEPAPPPPVAALEPSARLAADLVPGRGLVAPPPPSHAPPSASI